MPTQKKLSLRNGTIQLPAYLPDATFGQVRSLDSTDSEQNPKIIAFSQANLKYSTPIRAHNSHLMNSQPGLRPPGFRLAWMAGEELLTIFLLNAFGGR